MQRSLLAATLLVLAAACGEQVYGPSPSNPSAPPPPPPSPPPPPGLPTAGISMVSGDRQESDPGKSLTQPLVVRISNGSAGVPGFPVVWRLDAGSGLFGTNPYMVTDANGEARMTFTPYSNRATVSVRPDPAFGAPVSFTILPRALAVFRRALPPVTCSDACEQYVFFADSTFELRHPQWFAYAGTWLAEDSTITLRFADDPGRWEARATLREDTLTVRYNDIMEMSDFESAAFLADPERSPGLRYRLAIAGGDGQPGQADVPLRMALMVTVTDGLGSPLPGQPVSWRVLSGAGELPPSSGLPTFTNSGGGTGMPFRPTGLGTAEVQARLGGISQRTVTFRIHTSCWATFSPIMVYRDERGMDDGFYLDWFFGERPVRLGTTLEWKNLNTVADHTVRIKSISVPDGGTPLDTGVLHEGETYRFVADAPGTWQFVDLLSGLTGRLVVSGLVPQPQCNPDP